MYSVPTMTLRFRRKMFIFFIILFVLASTGIICYTQGYRFDFQKWAFTKTGSLYIEVSQNPVEIYLNQKRYTDKSGLLKKGTLISSILPKKYRVQIKKEGYIPYEKNIDVLEFQVTRLFHIQLVPTHLDPTHTFPFEKTAILKDFSKSGTLLMTDKNGSYVLLDTRSGANPVSLKSYIAGITKNTYDEFSFQPEATGITLLGTRKNTLYTINKDSDTITQLISGTFSRYVIKNSYFYGINSATSSATTSISVFDTGSGSKIEEFSAPFAEEDIRAADGIDRRYAFLLSNGDVWVREDGIFEKIAHDAKRIAFSPDASKLLFQDTGGPFFVYLLRDEFEALGTPKKKSIRIQISDAQAVGDISWYTDSYHLIAGYPSKITFVEVTGFEPNNQPVLLEKQYTSFLYSHRTNELFVSEHGAIERYDLKSF